jgi:hypothetical protein
MLNTMNQERRKNAISAWNGSIPQLYATPPFSIFTHKTWKVLPWCMYWDWTTEYTHRVAMTTFWRTFHHDVNIRKEWVENTYLSVSFPNIFCRNGPFYFQNTFHRFLTCIRDSGMTHHSNFFALIFADIFAHCFTHLLLRIALSHLYVDLFCSSYCLGKV